jgi:type VI protein secretion system component VasK
MARPTSPSPFDSAAGPVFELAGDMERLARGGVAGLVDTADAALKQFERDITRAGVPAAAVKPARYALAMLMDVNARRVQGLSLGTWSLLTQRQLFEGHDVPVARIREFRETAAKQGEGFADLERFLTDILNRAEAGRHAHRRIESGNWGLRIAGYLVLLMLGLAGYAGWLEYRFHARLIAAFDAEAVNIGLDRAQEGAALVRRLDDMHAAVERVAAAAARAPLKRVVRLPVGDGETYARARYRDAIEQHVPKAIADGIEEVLGTQGDGLTLYDALRAWSVLTGEQAWSVDYLSGWLEDNGDLADIAGLEVHAAMLNGPSVQITINDATVMDQARSFAAEVPEPARAWLELLRSERMRALPAWLPTAQVNNLETVLLRRSGADIATGIPGIFTAQGWTVARDFGVGGAVQRARDLGTQITGKPLAAENNTPDLLMDRLHAQTLAVWKDWLADLRVRPFAQRETAIVVSGALAQRENPLTDVLRAVWVQVGGTDRARSHTQQLMLAREFGAMIQYVEQGRMGEISQLFSQLNVALGAIDIDAGRGTRRLMTIQDRARSIAALKSAPRIVVQIAEDVLAQSAIPDQGQTSNPLTRGWQQQVFPICRETVSNHYPFSEGPDAAFADMAALFGPQGALSLFVLQSAAPFLDTSESPWRWKPEARFAGVTPESAAFLERAMQVGQGLYGADGQLAFDLTLAALAERGQTMVAIGGAAQAVRATGAPAQLSWPGPQPDLGVEVSFREASDSARIIHGGPWGLLRLMDGVRVRQRDAGQRMLLDLRSESGRVFLEMRFETALNPASVRSAMQGLDCPPAL